VFENAKVRNISHIPQKKSHHTVTQHIIPHGKNQHFFRQKPGKHPIFAKTQQGDIQPIEIILFFLSSTILAG